MSEKITMPWEERPQGCNDVMWRYSKNPVIGLEHDRLMLNLPVDTVLAETGKDIHLHRLVVATEHTCIAITERNYSTVEDTVRCGDCIAVDNRVL